MICLSRERGSKIVISPVPMAMREKDNQKKHDFCISEKIHVKRITTISDPRANEAVIIAVFVISKLSYIAHNYSVDGAKSQQ